MNYGVMVYWRFKNPQPGAWRFGYTSDAGPGLVRMGHWNGDVTGGTVVTISEIETKPYT